MINAGQSNAAGYGATSELTDQSLVAAYPSVPFWYRSNDYVSTALGSVAPIGTNNIGEELKLARLMDAAKPAGDVVAILKVAKGGSTLYGNWRSHEGDPYPPPPTYAGKGDWWTLLETHYAAAVAALAARYPNHLMVPALLVWAQGESDASNDQGVEYEARLGAFLDDLRTLTGNANMHAVVHKLSDDFTWGSVEATNEVRASQAAAVVADGIATLIDNDDFTLYNSGHVKPDDTVEKAERSFAAYVASAHAWRKP